MSPSITPPTSWRSISSTGKTVDHWPGISSDNLARQIVLHPKRDKAYLSHIRSAVEHAQGEGSIFPYVTVLDTKPADAVKGKRRHRIPMDSFVGTYVTANPWEVAISPDGKAFLRRIRRHERHVRLRCGG